MQVKAVFVAFGVGDLKKNNVNWNKQVPKIVELKLIAFLVVRTNFKY